MFNYCIDFRSLKCDRLRVHKNFMVSLIIRYVVSVIYYEPYIYGDPKAYVWYRGYVSFFLTMDTIYYLIKENLSILSN